jgi:hypothetical protein
MGQKFGGEGRFYRGQRGRFRRWGVNTGGGFRAGALIKRSNLEHNQ